MPNLYNGPLNKNSDFAAAGPNGEPASGLSVQTYIKSIDAKKVGVGYTLEDGSAHLLFADSADRDTYIANNNRTDLIIDTIELEALYNMNVTLLSPSTVPIKLGDVGNVIRYTFNTKNKNNQDISEDVTATYTITRGANTQVVTENYHAGTTVAFNVDQYLLEGSNNISISVKGKTSKVSAAIGVTYQVINLRLTDSMDISTVYGTSEENNMIEIPYIVQGSGLKTMEWYIDGEQLEFVRLEDEINEAYSERTKFIPIAGLSQGRHSVQFRVGMEISGETFYSNTLYRDVIIYGSNMSADPVIAIASEFPVEDGIFDELSNVPIYPTQYEPYTLRLAVWNPDGTYSNTAVVSQGANTLASITCLEGEESSTSITFSTSGSATLTITVDGVSRNIALDVAQTTMNIHEISNDLELGFAANGRTNSASNKDSWSDGTHTATFNNFEWIETSGWVDGKLLIPSGANVSFDYTPLSGDPTSLGKTIELEFKTVNVNNDNAVLLDLMDTNNNCGIKLTATEIQVRSRGGVTASRRFKTDENLRISIVMNRKTGATHSGLLFVYFNGILSIAQSFATTDSFASNKQLVIGGTNAGLLLKQLRIYNTALSADSILNNYILYRDTMSDMLSIYNKNDLYETGTSNFDLDKIASFLPVMIITGDMTPINTATDSKATTYVDVEYTNLQNPSYSFKMTHATMRPQGTSSLTYPRKNLRLYTRKSDDTVLYNSEGQVVTDRLYSFKAGAQPVDCWTLKADFAESSSTHNTGVARIWNDVMKNAQVGGEYVLRTAAQQAAVDNNYGYDVRTTVDGFPIVVFHRATEQSTLTFLGKYNFNNDKSTESVFGFKNIPGFDNSDVQCWEFRDSGFDLALFKTPTSSGRTYSQEFDYYASNYEDLFKQVWESRYPDTDSPSYTALKRLATWINSTENNLQKWVDEKEDYFDLPKLAAYYVYLMRFGAVDQTVKNSMITTEDGLHWYFINYDNDTILGVRNDGLLKFGPEIDRQSPDPELGGYAYAGHDSVLWNNFEADTECMELVRTIDSALFTAGLTYANMINMFNNLQAGKWAESIYNQDASYKYLDPYLYESKNYLGSLQGSRSDHRKWWISNRFSLYDAKYVNDAYNNNAITLLVPGASIGDSFSITAGKSFYYGYGQNRQPVETGVYVTEDQSHTFNLSMNFEIGTPLRIYAPNYIKTLNLSGLMQYIGASNFNLSAAYDPVLGSNMKNLILGVDNHYSDLRRNNALSSLSGLANITTLESLNVAGFTALTSLDLSTLVNLKTFRAKASGLTSVTFASGAPITTLELPATMQAITLRNLTQLTSSGLSIENDAASVNQIDIRNCQALSATPDFIIDWLDNKTSADDECSVYMDNVNWTNISNEDMQKLIDFKANGGTLTLRGMATMSTIDTPELAQALKDTFGEHVFSSNAPFYINAPATLYISGPSSIVEGESAQFTATVVGGELGGTYMYRIDSGSRTGTTLDQSTGLFQTTENGNSTVTFVVRVDYIKDGNVITGRHTIVVNQATYPSASILYIDGITSRLELGTPQTYEVKYTGTTVYTGIMTASWTLTGDLATYASIISQNGLQCTFALNSLPQDEAVQGVLTAAISKRYAGTSITSKTKDLGYQDDTIAISRAINPYAMDVMYNNGLCANQNYMTKTEAALVTELQLVTMSYQTGSSNYSSYSRFYSNTNFRNNCKNFDEFQYFTGLTKIPFYCFYQCCFDHIILPPTITRIERAALVVNSQPTIVLNSDITWFDDNCIGGYYANQTINLEGDIDFTKVTKLGNSCFKSVNPDWLNNKDIVCNSLTSFGYDVFKNSNLKSISLNYFTFSSNGYEFSNCQKLTSVDLSRTNITYFGSDVSGYEFNPTNYRTFSNCPNLTTIVLPSCCTKLGRRALEDTPSLTNINLNNITSVYNCAFTNCGLTSVNLPSLTTIYGNAFKESNITTFEVPSSVNLIKGAFVGVTTLTVNSNNSTYYSENNAVYTRSDNALVAWSSGATTLNQNSTTLLAYCCADIPSITTFDFNNISIIQEYAFYECNNLETVYNTNSITSIGNSAFYKSGIQSFNFSNVTSIGSYAFAYSGITSFTRGSQLTNIGTYAFTNCASLTNIDIAYHEGYPDLSIGSYAFNIDNLVTFDWSGQTWSWTDTITRFIFKTLNVTYDYTRNGGNIIIYDDIDAKIQRGTIRSAYSSSSPVLFSWQKNNFSGEYDIDLTFISTATNMNFGLSLFGSYNGKTEYKSFKITSNIPMNVIGYNSSSCRMLLKNFIIPQNATFSDYIFYGGNSSSYYAVAENIIVLDTIPPTISGIYQVTPGANTPSIAKTMYDNMKIWVPQGYGATYKAASGWSQYADQIYELDANGEIPEE